MHSPTHQPSEASLKEGYETSDMKPGIIMVFLMGLIALLASGIIGGTISLRYFYATTPSLNTVELSPLAPADIQVPTQMPYLQGDPVADRRLAVAAQKAVLESYGWVSDQEGMERARLPIAVAMERVAAGTGTYRQAPQTAILEPILDH